jgi:DHA3 family tetracycline resistance protein-like MFS transporter
MGRMNLTRSLQNRKFASLWMGQAVSRLGDSLYRIALAWWVLEKTGSAAAMGTVLVFTTVPMLVFMLVGGVMVDRLPRQWVMLASDLARGGLVGGVALLAALGILQMWEILVASALFGLVDAFFQPAYSAILPEITGPEGLQSANSLTALSGQVTGIIGPALGALIVGAGGTSIAFGLDAVSFFLSAASLTPVLHSRLSQETAEPIKRSMLADLRGGIQAVTDTPWLWITISIAALANMTGGGVFSTSLPFLVRDTWHQDVKSLGVIYSAVSVGSVLGALVLGNLNHLHHRGPIAYLLWVLGGALLLTYGFYNNLLAGMIVAVIIGACMAGFGLIWINTLQEMVPHELLGRVTSIDFLGSYTLLPVGYALAGWATDRFGAPLVFLVGGSITTLLALSGLLHPAIRRLD